jgi:hypothetical protein
VTATRGGIDTINLPMSEEDRAQVTKRIDRLRTNNTVILGDMQNRGAQVDFMVGMIHTYFEALVDIGALEQDQWLALQLIWEERFNDQLTTTKRQFEGMVEQARNRAKLAVASAQPGKLILPGA